MLKQRERLLKRLEKKLNHQFHNLNLLDEALTHRSYVHENPKIAKSDNERLEFLGDSILGFLFSDYLYCIHTQLNREPLKEGELAKLKSALVSRPALAYLAKKIRLGQYLALGKGEEASGGKNRISILGDAFEALIGALYLDGGLKKVKQFIFKTLKDHIDKLLKEGPQTDYKSILQEFTQSRFSSLPRYQLVSTSGPEHNKVFKVKVFLKNKCYGTGEGKSKKEAEARAAKSAYSRLIKLENLSKL